MPENGTIEKGAAELIYTPDADFCGTDNFTYTLFNDKHSSTATVTVEVTCDETTTTVATTSTSVTTTTTSTSGEEDGGDATTTNPPEDTVKANDDFAYGTEDTALSIPVLANDIIPDGSSGAFGTPLHGSILDVTENGLIYMPSEGYCGPDEFIYEVYFGDVTESAVVRIEIACAGEEFVDQYSSPAPTATTGTPQVEDISAVNDVVVVTMNSGVNMIDVLANDVDPSGNDLFVQDILFSELVLHSVNSFRNAFLNSFST